MTVLMRTMMKSTEEQKAQRLLLRLQVVIEAYRLPFNAELFRPDNYAMGFQLLTKSIPGPNGSFDQIMGFLMGYIARVREENIQKHKTTDEHIAEAA